MKKDSKLNYETPTIDLLKTLDISTMTGSNEDFWDNKGLDHWGLIE